ncbi:MAG: hypothetical protein ACQEVA_07775 [Myxococcota bacterium]
MAEEQENQEDAPEEEMTEEERRGGQKIMCFVSKEMVPINQTTELEYMPGKKVRVLPKYIKYEREESAL